MVRQGDQPSHNSSLLPTVGFSNQSQINKLSSKFVDTHPLIDEPGSNKVATHRLPSVLDKPSAKLKNNSIWEHTSAMKNNSGTSLK